ncbi:MAG: hypothetical protein WD070_09030 [Pirellulaceae bacterium]
MNGSDAITPDLGSVDQLRRDVAALIAPINRVGLLDQSVANMYRHTVAPT